MPQLTRRTFTRSGLAGLFSLCVPTYLCSCAVFRSRIPIPVSVIQNKLKGMILLGAYGDALGAYHEPRGLEGYTGDPSSVERLPKAATYQPPGSQAAPWWVWVQGDELGKDIIGVPTDDSAFRLFILHPWLLSLRERQPTEALFADWMQARMNADRTFEVNQWQSRRQQQIRDWLIMFSDADRWHDAPTSSTATFMPTEGNPFFRPEIPIVFGMFMYLELAALYGGFPAHEVMNHFSSFSRLDQGYAGAVTGLFAGLMASAVSASDTTQSFANWYSSTTTHLLNHNPPYLDELKDAFHTAWKTGTENQQFTETDFLSLVKKEIYEAPLPSDRDQLGYRVFDPLLFFKQITAAVAYSGSDIQRALRLLASNPGDADTLPSMLGTLAGAWAGYSSLSERSPSLREDIQEVENTLLTLFGYQVDETSYQLAQLAKRIQYS